MLPGSANENKAEAVAANGINANVTGPHRPARPLRPNNTSSATGRTDNTTAITAKVFAGITGQLGLYLVSPKKIVRQSLSRLVS